MLTSKFPIKGVVISAILFAGTHSSIASPIDDVAWCFSADTKIKDQSMRQNNKECLKWVKKYGFWKQNDLAKEAVSLAKGGDSDGAMERILVCQCHNGDVQSGIRASQAEIISYLKSK